MQLFFASTILHKRNALDYSSSHEEESKELEVALQSLPLRVLSHLVTRCLSPFWQSAGYAAAVHRHGW